jgi:hypothetical protein
MVNEILLYFPIPIYKLFHLLSAFHTRLIPGRCVPHSIFYAPPNLTPSTKEAKKVSL